MSKPPSFPFAAIAGQDQLRLALLLAATDWRLGVLLRGDKGAGKTTAARALAEILPPPAPFVNLPIGATEDRVLGGIDIERALKGEPALRPGLLSQAHGGVLYIDEVNLLPNHLADALLDAAATGLNVVEREGFSASHETSFVLMGTMNPEEGALRPQLLDRFALCANVATSDDPEDRALVVKRRLDYDRDPHAFASAWSGRTDDLRRNVLDARSRLRSVAIPAEILHSVSVIVRDHGVRSLRADLAVVRASAAQAALLGSETVGPEHVEAVLPLVLAHRSLSRSPSNPPPAPKPDVPAPLKQEGERLFSIAEMPMPELKRPTAPKQADANGAVVRSRPTENPQELDVRATLAQTILATGQTVPRSSDLYEKVRGPRPATRYLFVIDSSGSHAAMERMRFVKGAVIGILEKSLASDDEVSLIAFRCAAPQVLLEPTRSLEEARAALEYLPTGGRTPLAQALELALRYITKETLLILVTDGRANVPSQTADPWADALSAASGIDCAALVIDTETGPNLTGRACELAKAMGAQYQTLDAIRSGKGVSLPT
jgi:magnesium chelatase subunit D